MLVGGAPWACDKTHAASAGAAGRAAHSDAGLPLPATARKAWAQ
jgi:hypothetical protein